MSTEQVVSDNNGQESGASAETAEKINEDKVAYSTHQRLLAEKKKQDAELKALREEREKAKLKEAEQNGTTKQLIESLRERAAEKEEEAKKLKAIYASEMISMQLREAIAKEGCLVDPDKAIKFLGESDYQALEIDDKFRIKKEDISAVVGNLKKQYDFMFKKDVKINDLPISGAPKDLQIPVSKMKADDIKALLKKEFAKQK